MPSSSVSKVLFIDDSEDITNVCRVLLENYGFEVAATATGREGVEAARSLQPEVIFLDMSLPDTDGLDVARLILSAVPPGEEPPAIFAFTGHRPDFFGDRLQEAGIKRCVEKSGDLNILRSALMGAILSCGRASATAVRAPIRVLLVEDNPADAQLFRLLLKDVREPFELQHLADGELALHHLLGPVAQGAAPPPDIIFLDINLPKRTGKEVLAELKSRPVLRQIPVIIFTTSRDQNEVRDCYELQASCFVSKPADLGAFRQVVRQIEEFWLKTASLPKPVFLPQGS